MHADGWGNFPNPRGFSSTPGIHAHFEGEFVKANVTRDAVKATVPLYRSCECSIQDRARAEIEATFHEVVPFYELELKGAFRNNGTPEGATFATSRLSAGATALRDMIVDAWRASADIVVGYPPVNVHDIETGKHILTRDDFGSD